MSVIPPVVGIPNSRGPSARIRYGALGDAWRLISSDLGSWLVVSLIAVLLVTAGYVVFTLLSLAASLYLYHVGGLAVALIFTIPVTLLLSGVMRRGLSQMRGTRLPPTSIFDLGGRGKETARYAGYITAVNVAAELINLGLYFALFSHPDLSMAIEYGLIVLLVRLPLVGVQAVLTLGIPLVFDRGLSAGEAFSKTIETFKSHFFSLWGMALLWGICAGVGMLACGVGILFTFPIAILTPAVIFDDFFPQPQAASDPLGYALYPRPPQ